LPDQSKPSHRQSSPGQPGPADARWFDAHLDLAYLAETGRDMHAPPSDARGRHQPVAVTLSALAGAGVGWCLGTIFTEPVDPDDPDRETGAFAYADGDALGAWKAGMRQMKLYQAWQGAGLIQFMPVRGTLAPVSDAPLHLGVLMEGADPIETPEQLDEWAELGVIAIGLTWARRSRYAGGNATPMKDANLGLSEIGRELVARIDARGLVHDLSHLSQRATDELLGLTEAPVMASHSNARSLMGGRDEPKAQRHLADETVREIARRGGVIGVNLLSDFLSPGVVRGQRASVADVVRHVEHLCEQAGSRRHVALGSDADGGFGADRLPAGIDSMNDLERITDALRNTGWSDAELTGFRRENWLRFWGW
jgi:membrane dipeptidase